MAFFGQGYTRIKERTSDKWVNHRILAPTDRPRQGLKPVSKRGIFNQFLTAVLTDYFTRLGVDKVCQVCYGKNFCGVLDPMHSRRRQDIAMDDWWYAFRVLPGGRNCHQKIDERGRRKAEYIIERLIRRMYRKLGLTESRIKVLLIESAERVKEFDAKRPSSAQRFQHFFVEFPEPEAPFEIDDSIFYNT